MPFRPLLSKMRHDLRLAPRPRSRQRRRRRLSPRQRQLVDAATPRPNDTEGILAAVDAAADALDAGDRARAAEHFIDYWMGAGSWQRMPEQRQAPIAAAAVNVRRWRHALVEEATPLAAFGALTMPVLYLVGKRSTAAARAVARELVATLPNVERIELDLGHMGPVTDPEVVNDVVVAFLERVGVLAPGREP